ncbi:uncharacterized protein F54H12.2-like [Lineus longissimus]|uniref:uncharacterized protein F54H12.2-like n=1 Tax=Lineus longissimus TaxID=88925 RepID=UPI00315DB1FA
MSWFLDAGSADASTSNLELFQLPPTQTALASNKFEAFNPLTSLEHGGPLEYKIHVGDEYYVDPRHVYLYMQAKIVQNNGDLLVDDEEYKVNVPDPDNPGETKEETRNRVPDKSVVFPVNNLIGSCFKQVEVFLNNKQVGSADSLYHYRHYLECLLSYSSAQKLHQLKTNGYYQDEGGMNDHEDTIKDESSTNKGAVARYKWTRYSKSVETMGKIHSELFEQDKLLLNKMSLSIKMHRNDPSVFLMAKGVTNQYKLLIEKAVLYVNVKKVSSHVRLSHEERLLKSNAKYPMRKVNMRFFSRGANRADLSEPNLVNGELPSKIVIGLVRTDAFNGNLGLNPFNFENFNVSQIGLRRNGQSIPYEPLQFDFEEDNYFMGYFSMMFGTNLWSSNISNGISMESYKNGFTLYGFNLTPDDSSGLNWNLVESGNISLDIRLKRPSDHSITIIAYLESDAVMEIESSRNIIYDE